MQTQPVAAVVVTHEVESFETWKRVFDGHAAERRSAGVTSTHINRHEENPNLLSVYIAGQDAAKLEQFLSSENVMSTMLEAGVKGVPHVAAVTPVEDRTIKNRPLPAVIVRHAVADFDTWKRAFDGHAGARERAGIIGHAVNRGKADPNLVVIYIQGESLDALRAFTSSAELKSTMQNAGVIGKPELGFVHGGIWES